MEKLRAAVESQTKITALVSYYLSYLFAKVTQIIRCYYQSKVYCDAVSGGRSPAGRRRDGDGQSLTRTKRNGQRDENGDARHFL